MNLRKQKNLLVVENPLGLTLCTIDDNETTYFFPVTRDEQEYIHWAEAAYGKLIEITIKE